jgi:hypothetical protein
MGDIGVERREVEFEPVTRPEPARHDDPAPAAPRREAPTPEPSVPA